MLSTTMVVVSNGDVMHFLRTKEKRQMKEKTPYVSLHVLKMFSE